MQCFHWLNSMCKLMGRFYFQIVAMWKFDSRTLLIFSYVIIVFSHALMTASIQTSKINPAMSWASLVAMYIFMTAYGL